MCTVSWTSSQAAAYQLFFNRDEQRTRPRALPPQQFCHGDRQIIAPIDERSGGSWIAVNDLGICAFLLNNHEATQDAGKSLKPFKSRGEIPIALCSQNGFGNSVGALNLLQKERYSPFFAGIIGPKAKCEIFCWDGTSFEKRSTDLPFITTSSFQSADVQSYRRTRFIESCVSRRQAPSPELLSTYHRDLGHEKPAFNPLMSRQDAETHCISRIYVGSCSVRFDHQEIDPSNGSLGPINGMDLEITI